MVSRLDKCRTDWEHARRAFCVVADKAALVHRDEHDTRMRMPARGGSRVDSDRLMRDVYGSLRRQALGQRSGERLGTLKGPA